VTLPIADRPRPHTLIETWHRDDLLAEVYRLRDDKKTEQQGRITAQRRIDQLEARLVALGDKRNATGQFIGEIGKRTKRDLTEVARLREDGARKDKEIAELRRSGRVYFPENVKARHGL